MDWVWRVETVEVHEDGKTVTHVGIWNPEDFWKARKTAMTLTKEWCGGSCPDTWEDYTNPARVGDDGLCKYWAEHVGAWSAIIVREYFQQD